MDYGFYARKAEIRRLVEEEGIPYTIISCNFFMSYLLPSLVQPGLNAPPRDEVSIFGDGNVGGLFCSLVQFNNVLKAGTVVAVINKVENAEVMSEAWDLNHIHSSRYFYGGERCGSLHH